MSWIHGHQQGPPPAVQTSSTAFSSQQQWQPQNFNQQQPPTQTQVNNSYSTATLPQGGTINTQQNWQQQNLHPSQQLTSRYFQKAPQLPVDNYIQQQQQQQQQIPTPPQQQQQHQQYPQTTYQSTQSSEQILPPNGPITSQQFIKIESMASPPPAQGLEAFDNQGNEAWGDWDWNDNQKKSEMFSNRNNSQHLIDESFKNEPNDNWQWGGIAETATVDNFQRSSHQQQQQQHVDVKQDVSNHTIQGDIVGNAQRHQTPVASPPPNMIEDPHMKHIGQSSVGFVQPMQPISSYNTQHVAPQSTKSLSQSSRSMLAPSQQQRSNHPIQNDVSVENIQNSVSTGLYSHSSVKTENIQLAGGGNNSLKQSTDNTSGSPVYVSQAKPVAQPARQYAINPTVDSAPILPIGQLPVTSTSPLPKSVNLQSNNQPIPIANATAHPVRSQSPGLVNLPPPPSQSPPQQSTSTSALPPPPPITQNLPSASNNPYKRAGLAQHHRSLITQPANPQQATVMPTPFYAPPPEEFQTQQNQEYFAPDNSEVVDRNFEVENQEIAPSNDRNQYLQTSHLSEEDYVSNRQDGGNSQDQNNEFDNFPPPGLSRLVLGQPEIDSQHSNINQPEIPPGFDRMIPGTELAASNINMERQADGQDTIPSPRSAFTNVPPVEENDVSSNIDITADRNLYLVPGESYIHTQRVVTGVENGPLNQGAEQREVELDGENLEDQQLQQQHQSYQHEVEITREEPIEGANTLDTVSNTNINHETESSLTIETNLKDLSNPSTANDESDHRDRHTSSSYLSKTRRSEEKKRRPPANDGNIDKRKDRYESEESDLSSERERRRYREGSVRNDRERDSKERDRRDKRDSRERDRYREEKDRDGRRYDRDRHRDKYDRDRERGRYSNRYETDSKYETEGSTRERRRGGGGGDRDRDRDRYDADYRREEKERRYRRDRHDRDERDYDQRDRRRGGGGEREYRDDRDRRRDPRDKNRSDYDDEYRKGGGSRSARDSDREKDRREKDPRYAHMYGYSQGYGYDPYTYYQQQQYYEQLRRTNPQAYAEWYRKYYGQLQATELLTNDGRESVHSGRSSANNEKDRADNLSSNIMDGATSMQEPPRLTPCKFTNEHSTVSLSAGLLVCVKPKYSQNGVTNIVKVLKIGSNDATKRLFQNFPGPLVRGLTHKKTIIEFCEEQIRLGPPSAATKSRQNSISSICSVGQANKASFTLMWNLLILLIRQNGMVIGADIAELLMKNKNQFPYEAPVYSKISNLSRRDSVQSDINRKSKDTSPSDADNDTEDEDPAENSSDDDKKSLSEEEITEKFRNYLLYGNVNEALDWATDNNLWGHALFLASKVDRRSHANVMMKFANKLSLNDPLQTLYQLMSGRTPSSVTSVQDEKWGDWRPHLAMILSNTSQKPELDRKAITTLGDSLYNRGDIFGAQFCYLMAQVGFGKYAAVNQESVLMPNSANAIRLILLGSSQHKPFREFATNEAIMMTEIYEYACSLNEDKFSIVEFQPYKYLLALRMLDYGFQLKTLMYMEQIAIHIIRDPSKHEPSFIEKVYNLADRLKFYDPVLEKTMDDQQNLENNPSWSNEHPLLFEDQKWLQDLRNISSEHSNSTYKQNTQQQHYQYGAEQAQIPSYSSNDVDNNNKALIDQQFSEINQQFSELNLQYSNFDPLQQQQQAAAGGTSPILNETQYQEPPQQQQQVQYLQNQRTGQDIPQNIDQYGQYYNQNQGFNTGQDSYSYTQPLAGSYDQQPQSLAYDQQPQSLTYDQQHGNQYWDQQQQQQQQQQNEIRPTISMPNTLSSKPGFYDDGSKDQNLSKLNQAKSSDAAKAAAGKNEAKNQNKNNNNSNVNSGWFGGIWNKLSLKPKNQMILPDDKNPTIVWDPEKKKWVNTEGEEDEHDSFKPPPKMSDIVPTQNNTVSQPPIPTYSNKTNQDQQINNSSQQSLPYMNQQQQMLQQQQQQQMPSADPTMVPQSLPSPMSAVAANGPASNAPIDSTTTKTPSLQSNMFKMQRNRTLKKSYVDVFNPSGAPPSKVTEPVLAPVLPPASVPQSGFFIPAPVPNDDSYSQQQQQQQQPQQPQTQEGMPQFYNPHQFGGYQQ